MYPYSVYFCSTLIGWNMHLNSYWKFIEDCFKISLQIYSPYTSKISPTIAKFREILSFGAKHVMLQYDLKSQFPYQISLISPKLLHILPNLVKYCCSRFIYSQHFTVLIKTPISISIDRNSTILIPNFFEHFHVSQCSRTPKW